VIHDEASPRFGHPPAPRCGAEGVYSRRPPLVSTEARPLPIDCPECMAIARRNVEAFAAGRIDFCFRADVAHVVGGIALAGLVEAVGLAA